MIRVLFAMRRLPELTPSQFQAYWHDHHAPLVRELASALRIRRYSQLHPLAFDRVVALGRFRGLDDPLDGVAEVWWDSLEAATSPPPDGRAAALRLIEDERTFIDLSRSSMLLVDERPIIG